MIHIQLINVSKSFKEKYSNEDISIFNSISLELQGPSIVSIVGPNGTGKTTFLKLLSGLLSPDEGNITINGNIPNHTRIGYMPQSNPVFPWRRVDDDIALPLEIMGISKNERRQQVKDLVKQFSFDLQLDRPTYNLSGGQRQIVNLCRALIGNPPPKLLLLDEPFSALDPLAREDLIKHLQKVQVEIGLLIIITTHHLDIAVLVSDQILPFPQRPLSITQKDIIPIDITHPRSHHVRIKPKFQFILETLEELFQKK